MPKIYVDADACPVKDEGYRVAQRYGLKVLLVSNAWLRAPNEEWVEVVVVGAELDAADAWIVEHVTADGIEECLCLVGGHCSAFRNRYVRDVGELGHVALHPSFDLGEA